MKDKVNAPVYFALLLLVSVAALVTFNIWYTARAIAEADKRWCALMVGIDDNNRAIPPEQMPERTKRFAGMIRQLRQDLHCQQTPQPPIIRSTPSNPPR